MNAFDAFQRLVDAARGPLPLLQIAAQLPQYAEPDFEPAQVVAEVQGWGKRLRARLPADASALHRLRQLNHFFFDELRFRASADSYYDVANSYLHRVIARRAGIPISLSLLYLEIGRVAGLRLLGVGFPGHFLVKLALADGAMLIDVFGGGIALSADDLRARLKAVLRGEEEQPLEAYLRAATEREIVARMLRNLKSIHLHAADWSAALEVQNRLVALLPAAAAERRDRALLYDRLECPRAAADDLAAYFSLQPNPPDADDLRGKLAQWRQAARALN